MALVRENHDYKTVIVDSVTALGTPVYSKDVPLDNDPKKPKGNPGQALGGYGNGSAAVAAQHERVRKACGILRDKKGMHVVFIAHAEVETIQPPDDEGLQPVQPALGQKVCSPVHRRC